MKRKNRPRKGYVAFVRTPAGWEGVYAKTKTEAFAEFLLPTDCPILIDLSRVPDAAFVEVKK